MGNLIMNFLQEQGMLVVLGLMVAQGLLHQIVASRRYRKLQGSLRVSATGQRSTESMGTSPVMVDATPGTNGKGMTETEVVPRKRGRRTGRRPEVGRSVPDRVVEPVVQHSSQEGPQDLDAQLFYLKQSLDRIAAGRDQKLEEVPREHRKLTPQQEAVIADILKEYLS